MTAPNSPDQVPPPQRQQRNTPSPSPRPAGSLQAAATVNAGLQHEPSRRSSSGGGGGSLARNIHSPRHHGRRRSSVLMNLQLNDPSVPAPGEMITDTSGSGSGLTASPQPRSPLLLGRDPLNHGRAPSLGEIHQEFEAETEAHVNRLLHIIQQQQLQLQQLQQSQSGSQGQSPAANGDETTSPTQGGGSNPSSALPILTASSSSLPRSPIHPRSSFDLARADLQRRSRTPSRGASPRLRSTSISGESGDPLILGGRDESAFYQAETQMLTRENQMLRHRVRELERQLQELANCSSAVTHEPFHHSHLTRSTSASEDEPTTASHSTEAAGAGGTRNQSQQQPASQPLPAPADAAKEK